MKAKRCPICGSMPFVKLEDYDDYDRAYIVASCPHCGLIHNVCCLKEERLEGIITAWNEEVDRIQNFLNHKDD